MNESLPAARGGEPSVRSTIPNWPPDLPTVEASVNACVADGSWGRYHSRYQDKLIAGLAGFFQCANVRLCSSGTIAVELALRGLGVRAGDEVILAAYDFPGNFRAVEAIGAIPVLVDVAPGGWTFHQDVLADAISEKTKAVLISHLHGQLAPIAEVADFCHERGIPVVEDACQVPGALIAGRRCGSIGDVGVLSFGGSKLLTAGRGGAIVTDRQDVAQRITVFADRGNDSFPLSQLQCAAVLPQLSVLDEFNRRRLNNAKKLQSSLTQCRTFTPLADRLAAEGTMTAFYKFPVLVNGEARDYAITLLQEEGIPIDTGFRGFAKRSRNRCRATSPLSASIAAAEQTMLLHHPVLLGSDDLLDELIKGFEKVDRFLKGDPVSEA